MSPRTKKLAQPLWSNSVLKWFAYCWKAFISNISWIWNSTTMHMKSIFQIFLCLMGLPARIPSEWLGKKFPTIKNDNFLTFYWHTLMHFDFSIAMNWLWLSKVLWIFHKSESRRLYNFLPGPAVSYFEIKMLVLQFWVKKIAKRGCYKLWKWSQIKSKLNLIG